jgi:serine/threonine protein phosphatase 1
MRFVITDIHGCFKTFRSLLEDIVGFSKKDILYLLGDYIDRGPYAKSVINYIITLIDSGYDIRLLRGNHEEMLLNTYKNPCLDEEELWFSNGGKATLKSYGIINVQDIPDEHILFFEKLNYYFELPDYFLVHAGFDYSNGIPLENKSAMLWTRNVTNNFEYTLGKTIVHGHTPETIEQLKNDIENKSNVINIDTGCVYNKFTCLGYLICLNLDNKEVFIKKNIDFTK